jgi:TolA-binding protein
LPDRPSIAAAAAFLLLSGCATGDPAMREDLSSLKTEVRTLQRENADLARRVEAMNAQLDLVAARSVTTARPVGGDPPPAPAAPAPSAKGASAKAPSAKAPAAPAVQGAEPLVPAHLKVVKLEQATPAPAKGKKPPVPTATPIQDPPPGAADALASNASKPSGAGAQAALDAARAQSGLPRARALEQFAEAYPGHPRAVDALVDAARTRSVAGDPDGSCEDFARAVSDFPAAAGLPDAIEGLAACEQRRGRPAEAQRLQARLVKEFPDSPAGKRAREHAPVVQGAAP